MLKYCYLEEIALRNFVAVKSKVTINSGLIVTPADEGWDATGQFPKTRLSKTYRKFRVNFGQIVRLISAVLRQNSVRL